MQMLEQSVINKFSNNSLHLNNNNSNQTLLKECWLQLYKISKNQLKLLGKMPPHLTVESKKRRNGHNGKIFCRLVLHLSSKSLLLNNSSPLPLKNNKMLC
jgi:hypothetical protein